MRDEQKASRPREPCVAAALNNLAELYRAQSRYPEAEPLYKRALAKSTGDQYDPDGQNWRQS